MKVIDGAAIWRLHAQDGFPVEFSLPMLADRNAVPSWDRLLESAKSDGANILKLVDRLKLAVSDAYAPEAAGHIHRGLDLLVQLRRFQCP